MNTGQYNRRIKLYTVTRASDGVGGYIETPVLQKETWASVSPMSQREVLLYGMEVGVRAYKIRLRWDLNYDIDQSFYITYVDRFGNEKELRVISIIDNNEGSVSLTILANVRTD